MINRLLNSLNRTNSAHSGNNFEKLKFVTCDQFQNKDVSWTDLIVNQAFSSVAVFFNKLKFWGTKHALKMKRRGKWNIQIKAQKTILKWRY